MTAIERAEALLEAVSFERECNGLVAHGDCDYCNAWESLDALGLNRDTLRGYIGAVKVLKALRSVMNDSAGVIGWHLNGEVAEWGEFEFEEDMEQSIADFERLFPETNREQS